MKKSRTKLLLSGILFLFLMMPMSSPAQDICPFLDQGDVALVLADTLGLIPGSSTEANAIAALNAVGIYPGALGDLLPPSETDGWVEHWPVTNDLFCEQLVYLVWAAASAGSIVADPGEAAGLVLSLALECGVVCPGPPPEEVIIIPPRPPSDDPEEEEPG